MADEKRAFDDMLAEIAEDDSSEDERQRPSYNRSSKFGDQDSKSLSAGSKNISKKFETSFMADAKTSYGNEQSSKRRPPSENNTNNNNTFQLSREEQEIENFGVSSSRISSSTQQQQQLMQQQQYLSLNGDQVTISKRWLTRPVSKGERQSMKCYIERDRQGFSSPTIYRCYLESAVDLASGPGTTDKSKPQAPARFMMSAKKRTSSKMNNSYYLISLDMNPDDDKGSESVLGKVRSNNIGSRYVIMDNGLAPEKTDAPSMLRKEYGLVSFEFDSGGPSHIEAWVPFVSAGGMAVNWQPMNESSGIEAAVDTILASTSIKGPKDGHLSMSDSCNGNGSSGSKLFYLQNKAPKWDEAHGGHVLNFQGRVTESSVKNFQLVCLNSDHCDPEDITLQFGRVGKHRFTMDLLYPLSPLQAFSICVACLDGKIADRKGYEFIKKIAGTVSASTSSSSGQEFYGNKPVDVSHVDSEAQVQSRGNVKGSSSLSGILRENIPSTQYLRDKINRTFK